MAANNLKNCPLFHIINSAQAITSRLLINFVLLNKKPEKKYLQNSHNTIWRPKYGLSLIGACRSPVADKLHE